MLILKEIRAKETGDLRQELADRVREVFFLQDPETTEKAENPGRIRALRKDVARIKTVLRERELGVRGQSHTSEG